MSPAQNPQSAQLVTSNAHVATLGGMRFRINPSLVSWNYEVDVAVTQTLGGRVVQVYGATLGDLTIQGLYGQQRTGTPKESWELAESFADQIALMMKEQSKKPTLQQLTGADPTPMHPTFRFYYDDDTPERRKAGLPLHHWDFNVYVKSLRDADNPAVSVEHKTGKFSYGYVLTLFIVEDNTGQLAKIARDDFISRLSDGLGWKRSSYQGHMTTADLQAYLQKNSPDGTIHGLELQKFTQAATGQF